ncbi:MAG: hypothetical protein WA874_08590, partial [Chryseosolibacter sp.]
DPKHNPPTESPCANYIPDTRTGVAPFIRALEVIGARTYVSAPPADKSPRPGPFQPLIACVADSCQFPIRDFV